MSVQIDEQRRTLVPQAYAVHLIQESAPGDVASLGLTPSRADPIHPGLARLAVKIVSDFTRWREVFTWQVTPPSGYDSLVSYGTGCVNYSFRSDGRHHWTTDPSQEAVFVATVGESGTWPGFEDVLRRFARHLTMQDILENRYHCTPGVLLGRDEVAGRRTWVVEFDEYQCLQAGKRHRSRVLDGRAVFWIDVETFFTLREQRYAYSDPERLVLTTAVTQIDYDQALDDAQVAAEAPAGYRVVHTG